MATRRLVLKVEVVELDENHNVVSTIAQHAESYPAEYALRKKDELIRCAYLGFETARNEFYLSPDR